MDRLYVLFDTSRVDAVLWTSAKYVFNALSDYHGRARLTTNSHRFFQMGFLVRHCRV